MYDPRLRDTNEDVSAELKQLRRESEVLRQEFAIDALRIAIVTRRPTAGLVHHSDRGSQYCSIDYLALLRRNGICISM
jgi:putative transposase